MDSSDFFDELFPKGALNQLFSDNESDRDGKSVFGTNPDFERKIWTVQELTDELSAFIDMEFGTLWLEGEIGQVSKVPSGHIYFSIKDEHSVLQSVCFRSNAVYVADFIKEGAYVLCHGRLNLFSKRGQLQFIIDHIEPWGQGRLRLEFERLKKRLEQEGLFDPKLKKSIPFWPERIFLITSPSGAAVRDFIKTLRVHGPAIEIVICPTRVQGDEAVSELINALDQAESRAKVESDVIVIARGGGSLEDLWVFNSEELARRIFECKVPVVSAIGHEIDFTICDFVSDVRAATPTAAAQIVVPSRRELRTRLNAISDRLQKAIMNFFESARGRLAVESARVREPSSILIENRLILDDYLRRMVSGIDRILWDSRKKVVNLGSKLKVNDPSRRLDENAMQLSHLRNRLSQLILNKIENTRAKLLLQIDLLNAMSPFKGLDRGYVIVKDESTKSLVTSIKELERGQRIELLLRDGKAYAEVYNKMEE